MVGLAVAGTGWDAGGDGGALEVAGRSGFALLVGAAVSFGVRSGSVLSSSRGAGASVIAPRSLDGGVSGSTAGLALSATARTPDGVSGEAGAAGSAALRDAATPSASGADAPRIASHAAAASSAMPAATRPAVFFLVLFGSGWVQDRTVSSGIDLIDRAGALGALLVCSLVAATMVTPAAE